jgi:hypothetical protein
MPRPCQCPRRQLLEQQAPSFTVELQYLVAAARHQAGDPHLLVEHRGRANRIALWLDPFSAQVAENETPPFVLHGVARTGTNDTYATTKYALIGRPPSPPHASTRTFLGERATGIEPAFSAWEYHRG